MAAWGCVGLAGAALGALSARRLGRVQLALGCGVAALGAKELMNVYTWTIGASHTPAAFLAAAGTALPFDATDVIASFLFGFAFAPELARLLARLRARMDVTWEAVEPSADAHPATPSGPASNSGLHSLGVSGPLLALALAVAVGLGPALVGPTPAAAASLNRELGYLARAQNPDGGYGASTSQHSSELYTAWVAMGLAASGREPTSVRRDGHSLLDSLRGQAQTLESLGDVERTVLAARACGVSPYSFAGRNLVAEVLRGRASDGSFAHQVNLSAFAVFALRAAGHSSSFAPIAKAAGWIERQQNSDGGFGFGGRGSRSDVDDTAAALQALIDAGARQRRMLSLAAGYLTRSQNVDGGFPQQDGGESNAQSTAWAVQGLIAAGVNPSAVRRKGSRSPVGYLESLLAPDGSIRYSRTSAQTPAWVTAQALIALAGKTFPVG
jgi:prenyltransferase beta subunit